MMCYHKSFRKKGGIMEETRMSKATREEIVKRVAARYHKASKLQRNTILNELLKISGNAS